MSRREAASEDQERDVKLPVTIDFETKAIEKRPAYPPEPVGVAIKYPGRKGQYLAWGHPEGNNTTKQRAKEELRDIVRSGAETLFHNSKFDVDVMEEKMGVRPPPPEKIHDTMYSLFMTDPHAKTLSLKPSSERLLGLPPDEQDAVRDWLVSQKIIRRGGNPGPFISEAPGGIVGTYAIGDVDRTLGLHRLVYPQIVANGMLDAYRREQILMPLLLQNERRGLHIDVPLLMEELVVYELALIATENWLRRRLKAPDLDFNKDRQLADALERSGVVTEFVVTEGGQNSVSKQNLTPDMFSDRKVASALGYRNRLATCLSTFMRPWAANQSGGYIHTNWNQVRQNHDDKNQAGARTGRMSSNPNFMNIPTDWMTKDDGYVHPAFLRVPPLPKIRRYVLPDPDCVFLHRDYNQQELRILAHFENGTLMGEYQTTPTLDIHTYIQKRVEQITGMHLERRAVKVLNFGMIYGMGAGALARKLGITEQYAKEIKAAHRRALPDLKALEREIKELGKGGVPIVTWGGRQYLTEPPIIHKGRKMSFEYKLLNYLIQGSAADITKQAIINYHQLRREGRFLVTVHDEINISAPKKAAKREMELLREAMQSVPLDVTLLTDGKMGPNWAELQAA
jgi:DNA polymerase-1